MPEMSGLSRFGSTLRTVNPSQIAAPSIGQEAKLALRFPAGAPVESLAFSPNRTLLAVGCSDGTGRVWEIAGGSPTERGVFRLDAAVGAVAFASNNRTVAAGSASGVVKVFELTSATLRDAGIQRGSRGAIEALAFSPDCTLLAGAGADQILRLWEPGKSTNNDPRSQLPGHTQRIRAIAFAPDGHGIATASADSTARIWALNRIRPGQLVSLPHCAEVVTVSFSPDGRTLAASGQDQVIWLWDLTATKPTVRTRLVGHPSGTRLVQFSSDGETVVSVGGANDVMNWSPRSGRLRAEWSLPGAAGVRHAITADGRYLARAAADGTVELFRVADKRK